MQISDSIIFVIFIKLDKIVIGVFESVFLNVSIFQYFIR